jgi:hypothetical protein
MNSASKHLFNIRRTRPRIFRRGKKYAKDEKVSLKECDNKEATAVVSGSKAYNVSLQFRGNGISRSCTCPYAKKRDSQAVCKHMVATAIVWDQKRDRPVPNNALVEKRVEQAADPVSRSTQYVPCIRIRLMLIWIRSASLPIRPALVAAGKRLTQNFLTVRIWPIPTRQSPQKRLRLRLMLLSAGHAGRGMIVTTVRPRLPPLSVRL